MSTETNAVSVVRNFKSVHMLKMGHKASRPPCCDPHPWAVNPDTPIAPEGYRK
jgi:hypothetical protein